MKARTGIAAGALCLIAATAAAQATFRIASAQTTVDPALQRAYAALNAGELAAADALYALVLKSDANNADALHGLAVAALRRGHFDAAANYYLRAVHADPKDAIAVAGLIGLRGQSVPGDAESHLKNLLAEQPWQHVLHFALGNVYAAAGRWSEAQRAFFNACSSQGEQPDYLFNLAVSLDRLRQSGLAAQYYGRAIAAAERQPAAFDRAQAAARLRILAP